jgi:hypothetical protein
VRGVCGSPISMVSMPLYVFAPPQVDLLSDQNYFR